MGGEKSRKKERKKPEVWERSKKEGGLKELNTNKLKGQERVGKGEKKN